MATPQGTWQRVGAQQVTRHYSLAMDLGILDNFSLKREKKKERKKNIS
jgi:hypothetical protein